MIPASFSSCSGPNIQLRILGTIDTWHYVRRHGTTYLARLIPMRPDLFSKGCKGCKTVYLTETFTNSDAAP